jgi:hypothetical protein
MAGRETAEPQRSDFSGRWVPDFERWQGIERLLDLQNAPWLVRQAIGRVNAVEEISQSHDGLVVELDVPLPLPGKAWRLYGGAKSAVTLFPSVWRDTGCESHFIIWRDQIFQTSKQSRTQRLHPAAR